MAHNATFYFLADLSSVGPEYLKEKLVMKYPPGVRKEPASPRRSRRIREMTGLEKIDRVEENTFGKVVDDMIDMVEEENIAKVERGKMDEEKVEVSEFTERKKSHWSGEETKKRKRSIHKIERKMPKFDVSLNASKRRKGQQSETLVAVKNTVYSEAIVEAGSIGTTEKVKTIETKKRNRKGQEKKMPNCKVYVDQNKKRKNQEMEAFVKGKVNDIPDLVLEKIFSHLNWNDLETALLVCHRWKEVGSHPSLWTRFPLHLNRWKLSRLAYEVRRGYASSSRLAWVKSVTISLPKRSLTKGDIITPVFKHLTRAEEIFVLYKCEEEEEEYIAKTLENIMMDQKNRVVRTCLRSNSKIFEAKIQTYKVESFDARTIAFIKKTMKTKRLAEVIVFGPPGLDLCYQALEALFFCSTNPIQSNLVFTTNLTISKNMDLTILANVMCLYVHRFNWSPIENQDVVPLNAILNLMDSRDPGYFKKLLVPKDLLLKSHWQKKLEGNMIKLNDPLLCDFEGNEFVFLYADLGLKMISQ